MTDTPNRPPASRLGRMLTLYRVSSGTGVREMATEIGVSPATLSRIERGYAMDAGTLLVLWHWLLGNEGAAPVLAPLTPARTP